MKPKREVWIKPTRPHPSPLPRGEGDVVSASRAYQAPDWRWLMGAMRCLGLWRLRMNPKHAGDRFGGVTGRPGSRYRSLAREAHGAPDTTSDPDYGFAFQMAIVSGDPWLRMPLSVRMSSVAASSSLRGKTQVSEAVLSNAKTRNSSLESRINCTK